MEELAADRIESTNETIAGAGNDGGDSWHKAAVRVAGELEIDVVMDDVRSRVLRLVL